MSHAGSGAAPSTTVRRRLAAAPISWGICEVPHWGRMLATDRVLGEMAALGLDATELGAPGFLPGETDALTDVLKRHGLRLVGSFVAVVVHHPDADDAIAHVRRVARDVAAAGGDVVILALVEDADWSPPHELTAAEWRDLAAHIETLDAVVAEEGLTLVLHPHVDTLIETAEQVKRALELTSCGWCLDTGHLFIGGVDPAAFAREHAERVVHVHLKDVDAATAARLRAGELTLMGAVQAGLFTPLGDGDADIERVMAVLDEVGYEGWWVLEQDAAITGEEPGAGSGPMLDVRRSIDFITINDLKEQELSS